MGVDETVPLRPEEMLAAVGQAVIVTDADGVVVYWNAAAEELYGWSAEEAVGRPIVELAVPQPYQQTGVDILGSLEKGRSWTGSFPALRKDGSTFPALVTGSGIYRDGEVVGLVGISTNIGRALRPLLERSTDAALVLRADGIVTYASPAVEQLFGWDADALAGTSIVPLLHEDDREALAGFLTHAVESPGAHPPLELRVRAGGDWVWAEAALTNLLDDPEVRGVVCNLRRSARRTAQEEAETRARQLQTALESRLIIEQAKGFIAGRSGMTPEEAFNQLRRYARSNHLSIRDVSNRVVHQGLLIPVG
jgi:PAS domain S-box-containing protein